MITITDNALRKLKKLLDEQQAIGISISIISGGCSGIDYSLSYELQKNPQKGEIEVSGVLFFYEKAAEMLINGINIDVVENSFGHGFVITNKNHITCSNCSCNCKK
ncbi:MAG: iron-sulfur cluster assembly accessory protein [Holosporales bacterium]|nr:iron-sulfur cluster assembly accessory protein [Holosporales bacterium]